MPRGPEVLSFFFSREAGTYDVTRGVVESHSCGSVMWQSRVGSGEKTVVFLMVQTMVPEMEDDIEVPRLDKNWDKVL